MPCEELAASYRTLVGGAAAGSGEVARIGK